MNEKKTKSFNQKIIDNYLNEIKNEEKEQKEENKQNKKSTALKDIIEKLKAKKIEKEELTKKESEDIIEAIAEKSRQAQAAANSDGESLGKTFLKGLVDTGMSTLQYAIDNGKF